MTTDERFEDAMRQLRIEREERERRRKVDAAIKATFFMGALLAIAWAVA